MKLNVRVFAITCGVVWGLGLFCLTWWIIAFDGVTGETTLIGQVYRGFNISPIGSVIGLIWGFGRWCYWRCNICVAVQLDKQPLSLQVVLSVFIDQKG